MGATVALSFAFGLSNVSANVSPGSGESLLGDTVSAVTGALPATARPSTTPAQAAPRPVVDLGAVTGAVQQAVAAPAQEATPPATADAAVGATQATPAAADAPVAAAEATPPPVADAPVAAAEATPPPVADAPVAAAEATPPVEQVHEPSSSRPAPGGPAEAEQSAAGTPAPLDHITAADSASQTATTMGATPTNPVGAGEAGLGPVVGGPDAQPLAAPQDAAAQVSVPGTGTSPEDRDQVAGALPAPVPASSTKDRHPELAAPSSRRPEASSEGGAPQGDDRRARVLGSLADAAGPIAPVVDAVTRPVAPVLDPVAPVVDAVAAPVAPVLDPVAPLVESVTAPVGPALEPVAPVLKSATTPVVSMADSVAAPVHPLVESVTAPVVPLAESVTAALVPALEPAASLVESVTAPVVPVVESVTAPLAPIVDDVVVPAVVSVTAPVVPVVESVTTPLSPTVDMVMEPSGPGIRPTSTRGAGEAREPAREDGSTSTRPTDEHRGERGGARAPARLSRPGGAAVLSPDAAPTHDASIVPPLPAADAVDDAIPGSADQVVGQSGAAVLTTPSRRGAVRTERHGRRMAPMSARVPASLVPGSRAPVAAMVPAVPVAGDALSPAVERRYMSVSASRTPADTASDAVGEVGGTGTAAAGGSAAGASGAAGIFSSDDVWVAPDHGSGRLLSPDAWPRRHAGSKPPVTPD